VKKIYFIVLAITLLTFSSIASESKNENSDLFMGKWIINCLSDSNKNEKNCSLERSLFIDKEKQKKLITVIMQTNTSSQTVRFILISPLGTLIQSGVKIGFDNKLTSENAYAFNFCEKIGCITSMMVKEDTLERFKKSNNLDLEYVGTKGQKIEIKFNLNGFEKEFKKIESNS
tara:strand:- start:278 stop:796 length:519 start_codon:yes stop_codon:yes gene_type:complete